MHKVPLGTAAEVLYEKFKEHAPEFLGDYTSQREWFRFFVGTYSEVYNAAEGWVLVASGPLSHVAEVHAYAFDHDFGTQRDLFEEVIRDLTAQGKVRLWTTLMPRAGHRVRGELRELGFVCEGIMHALYYLGPDKGFADGELWARISIAQEAGDGEQ